MAQTLRQLETLKRVLDHLDAERPAGSIRPSSADVIVQDDSSEGRTVYQERGGDLTKRLDVEIKGRLGRARILLTGQIGVGKSSELLHYFATAKRRPGSPPLIFCDLEKHEHPERCGPTGVFLTILRDSWAGTRRFQFDLAARDNIRDEILDRMIDWLKGQKSSRGEIVFKFGGMDFPVYIEQRQRNRALSLILGKAAQHEAVSSPTDRFGLVPDLLINLLNKLLDWFARQHQGQPPVVIVDHVDKIRDARAAEDVLVKSVPQWNRIAASLLMTAPFEYTLGELRDSVESKWGRPLMVYPIEIPSLDDHQIPQIYRRIVDSAGLSPLVHTESLRLLAHFSGGILRLFVQFLIQACKEAHLNQRDTVDSSIARDVILDAQRAYQDYGVKELQLLDQVETEGTGLREAAALLRSPIGLLVTAPKADRPTLRVHPLAVAALERFRRKRAKVAS